MDLVSQIFNQSSLLGLDSEANESQATVMTGQLRGESITVRSNPTSLLQSAAEEMTFAMSEKAEKTLSKRKVGKYEGRIDYAEKAQRYLEKIPENQKREALQRFIQELKQFPPGKQQLQGWLQQFSKDPSDRFAALQEMLKAAKQFGYSELETQLIDELASLEQEQGPETRAGLNIAQVTRQFASNDRQAFALRRFYRDSVLDYGGIAQTFSKILEKYGEDKIEFQLNFLQHALSADMVSGGSSINKSRLQAIWSDLQQMRTLKIIYERCGELLIRIWRRFQQARRKKGADLVSKLLKLTEESWLTAEMFTGVAKEFDIHELTAQIYFLREMLELARELPEKVFSDEEVKEQFMEAIQLALDGVIEEEEE